MGSKRRRFSDRMNTGRGTVETPYRTGYRSPEIDSASPEAAEQIAAVHRCIALISQISAAMPVRVVKWDDKKGYTDVQDHNVVRLLQVSSDVDVPVNGIPAFLWRQAATITMLASGNCCYPIRRNQYGQPTKLFIPRYASECVPLYDPVQRDKQYYQYISPEGQVYNLQPGEVLHFRHLPPDGFMGRSPLDLGAKSHGLTLSAENRNQILVKRGRPEGFLITEQNLGPEKKDEIRAEWKRLHEGEEYNIGVLSGRMDWKQYGFNADAIQLLQTRRFQISEICRWFGVPPHMVYNMDEKSSYSMASQLMIEFLQATILPLLQQLRGVMLLSLFSPYELTRSKYDIKFELSEIERADLPQYTASRMQFLQNGLMSINALQDEWKYPRSEGGDKPMVMASQYAPLTSVASGQTSQDPSKAFNPNDPTSPARKENK